MERCRALTPRIALVGALLGPAAACTEHLRRPTDDSAPPACPGDGWLDDRVPLFPGTEIRTRRSTTRGRMDENSYVGDVAAPFRRVRAFYVHCLGSEAEDDEGVARFARPVTGTGWEPGSGPLLAETPQDMADSLTLWDRGDGTTKVAIGISLPDGR